VSGHGERDWKGALSRSLALAVLLFAIWVLRAIDPAPIPGAAETLNLGILLLTAFIGGQVANRLGLSRVTGYIIVGLVIGPSVLGFLSDAEVTDLRPFSGLAIALIALTAGGELNLRRLRGSYRSLASITLVQTVTILLSVGAAVVLLRGSLPFTEGQPWNVVLAVAISFAAIAVASSPSVAIAVITDTKSKGPVSTTVLGVTVLKDVLVIILFAIALSATYSLVEPGAAREGVVADLAREIGGSLVGGLVVGLAIAAYLRWVNEHLVLFTIAMAWIMVEIAAMLHLELLLMALTAGFAIENLLPVEGTRFVEALEAASLPLYAVFFSLAGASVHLAELAEVWVWAFVLVGVRALAIFLGTDWGGRIGGSPDAVRRTAWGAFVSQAGVALGMAELLSREFPTWGAELYGFFVGMVAVHELVGPVMAKWSLDRAGEVGAALSPEKPGSVPAASPTPAG
jgi:Kef-type K+ transport system membrane component KefB